MKSCISRTPKYNELVKVYGETITRAIIRTLTKEQNASDYVIPTLGEARKFIRRVNKDIYDRVSKGLKGNPYMSLKGIVNYLQGAVSKKGDAYFIVKGDTSLQVYKEANLRTVFEPNLKIMEQLAIDYPDIFKLKPTSNPTTVIVEITPRIEEVNPIESNLAQSQESVQLSLFNEVSSVINKIEGKTEDVSSPDYQNMVIESDIQILNTHNSEAMRVLYQRINPNVTLGGMISFIDRMKYTDKNNQEILEMLKCL